MMKNLFGRNRQSTALMSERKESRRRNGQDVNRRNFLQLESLETRWALATVATAMNDVYHTPIDAPLAISGPGVLANDVSSAPGQPMTANLFSGPAHGQLTFNTDGSFVYTPEAGFSGMDSFVYSANDGSTNSQLAAVTINVSEGTEPISANDSFALSEDESLTIPGVTGVLANDDSAAGATVELVTGPSSGSLTLATDGGFLYTPEANFSGEVTFTYRATNSIGVGNEATVTLTIEAVNDAPIAANDSFSVDEDQPLTVTTSVMTNDSDVEGSALTAELASQPLHGTVTFNPDGTFTYQPEANFSGIDGFSYLVNDGGSNSEVATVTISVNPINDAPVAANDEYSIDEDQPLTVTGTGVLGNDSDIDSASLTASLVAGPTNGTVTLNADGSFVYTPAADFSGADSFTYTAGDGTLSSEVATVTINVAPINDSPVAVNDEYSTPEDTELVIEAPGILINDLDPDSSTLSVQIVNPPQHGTVTLGADGRVVYMPNADFSGLDGFSYTVSDGTLTSDVGTVTINVTPVNDAPLGVADAYTVAEDAVLDATAGSVLANDTDADSTVLTATLGTGPTNGTVALNADGTFLYTPAANFSGEDTFTYIVSDGELAGAETTVTITVTPSNDAPLAVNDEYAATEDTELVVTTSILANDSDPEGDTLAASIVSQPQYGTVTLNADGTFSYTPNADFSGVDGFSYMVSDGSLSSDVATVTITVAPVNDAPIGVADAYTMAEDGVLDVGEDGVLANDTDVDSTELTATMGTGPANGVVTFNADGTFIYTPNANFTGEDSFTYTVSDGELASSETMVTISVASENDGPSAVADAYTTDENQPLQIAAAGVLSNDTDPDGDPLTAAIVTGPTNGTVSLAADGSFLYTPNAGFAGTDTFTYAAGDGTATSEAIVTITVNDVIQPPTTLGDAYSIGEDMVLDMSESWGVLANDVDPQGTAMTAEVVTGPANGTLVLDANGAFRYTPNANFNGSDSFTYRATNADGEVTEGVATIVVEALNDAPQAADDAYSVAAGASLQVSVAEGVIANDSDVDAATSLTSSMVANLVQGPQHGTLVFNGDGSFTYTPDAGYTGVDTFSYQLNDGMSNSQVAHASITVSPEGGSEENVAPVSAADSYTTSVDQTLNVSAPGVLSNDSDLNGDTLTAQIVTSAANGQVTLAADGSFVYVPNAGFVGSDSFTYAAHDGTEAGAPVTVTLSIQAAGQNTRPTVNNDHYVLVGDSPFTVSGPGVLANDTDAQNDSLIANFFGGPQNGTVTLNADGGFTYTPNAGYVGTDSFLYWAWDGQLGSALAAVTLRVTAPPTTEAPEAPEEGLTDDDFNGSVDCVLANESWWA
ncbi:Ig-like domain-containing protein [Anatilimnocola sp. NA78]|uniref:Ig-like domain-containing protein n=1 Tax=Anatilimnocola sp. NA78 TaxID=3415683 RepID=UPI003CE4DC38